MTRSTEAILAPRPEASPRIYAYSIADAAHAGLLKIDQTVQEVKSRVAEQLKTAAIQNYRIELALEATQYKHGAETQRCHIVQAQ